MENEKGNGYGAGEGQGPDYHTDNREPVIVAEQPAQEVTGDFEQASGGQDAADRGMPGQSGPERGTAGWGTAGQNCAIQDGSDGWRSPMDAPSREDRWSDTGDKPYLGSPWEPTQSGTAYDAGKNNGASGNDSQPVYKPAPASYGQGQPGAGQSGSGGRDSGFSQNDSRQERGSGQPGGSSQYQTQYQSYPPVYQEKNNMATASLVMGILSLCSICCCMLFGIVFGVLGIIFAIMSKKGDRMDGQAKAGLILSIIGIAVTVLVIIFFVAIEVFTVIPELN